MKSKHLTVSERTATEGPRTLLVANGRPPLWRHSGVGCIVPDNSSDHSWDLNQGPDPAALPNARLRADYATEYPEVPLRVGYHFTPVGEKLASVIEQLRALETELALPVRE